MTDYRLFPATSGPSAPVPYSGPFSCGLLFQVTTGGAWFEGFWWWVCASGQSTAPQKFALWQVSNTATGTLIPSATVTSGALTPGQWNFVPLSAPIPLTIGACYNACTGFSGAFPDTEQSYGAGDVYSAGITHGPLSAFSDTSGTNPAPFSMSQGTYNVTGSDPAALMPANGNHSDNLWMDVQVSDTAPDGSSYRLWPNYPVVSEGGLGIANDFFAETWGTIFTLSQACTVNNIWHYSPPGVSALPDSCMIWDMSTEQIVDGTYHSMPSWSGPGGSGWVSSAYSGLTLPAGEYLVAVYTSGGNRTYTELPKYFGGNGPAAASGIVAGPLTAPSASVAGNSRYIIGGLLFPSFFDVADQGETRWVDVEVTPAGPLVSPAPTATATPAATPTPTPTATPATTTPPNSGAFLTFFP